MNSRPTLEQIDLGDGTKVWVQTVHADIAGKQLAGNAGDTNRMQDALDAVKPALKRVFQTLEDLNNPKTIEVEVGIGFSGKVGFFLASADTEATFKITLGWERA
jgi:hypothetical protein